LPGTPGLQHRIGGLEKQHVTGNVSYDPENHEFMVKLRAQKVENVAMDIPLQEVVGPAAGDLLVLSWGGTYGTCWTAVQRCQAEGLSVSHAHLRYLNPFPANLGEVLENFDRILIPEWNLGQLRLLIRDRYLVDAQGLNKVQGKPFHVDEIVAAIRRQLA
jgi:2-oxoglutarate ferredoxin oxidoreductase subunit alpha